MTAHDKSADLQGLHEAILLCMARKKRFIMSTEELATLNEKWKLWRRPGDTKYPEPWQVFLRANNKGYRWLFHVVGDKHAATVALRLDGVAKVGK